MDRLIIGYIWFLSILGAAFYGHEFGMTEKEQVRKIANAKLEKCNQIITGGLYDRSPSEL
jgi:hypothetical protein